jgi:hypothetical protein
MNHSGIRELMNAEWVRVDREAQVRKNSQSATLALFDFYRGLSDDMRAAADRVLVEWALSDDPAKQFDALAIIDEFSVTTAIPALKELALRFAESDEASSHYDLAKVRRILERLDV